MAWNETGSDAICRLRCLTQNYGSDKIIDLVLYRRQQVARELAATGTNRMVDPSQAKIRLTKSKREMAPYWEKLQANIGGLTVRKTLAIRNRLNEP